MYECQSCYHTFPKWSSCSQHMNALDHWSPQHECEKRDELFWTESDAEEHMDDFDHWGPKYGCDTCTKIFYTQRATEQHMDAVGHWEHYCHSCERKFPNANNLKIHLHSRTHQGANVTCPFCKRGFTTASGVAHHLETGSCPKAQGVDRKLIYQQLQERDSYSIVTKKTIGWHEVSWSAGNAWNGEYYECYLCHKQFGKASGLDQHLNSPTHLQDIYHCPNKKCGMNFKTLAAMFNHLESESCGFIKFATVNKKVNNFLFSSGRQIGFH